MPTFVRAELFQLTEHAGRGKARHEDLPAIDVDRTMLAGMIDLEDSITKISGDRGLRDHFQEARFHEIPRHKTATVWTHCQATSRGPLPTLAAIRPAATAHAKASPKSAAK
ncbi:hypothetical protein D3C81_1543860 [compost metagenome]